MKFEKNAIELVNQRLRHSPEQLSDNTILTVVTLAGAAVRALCVTFQLWLALLWAEGSANNFVQHLAGDTEKVNAHMRGVLQMIKLRGGFATLPLYLV
jgi:hypothetical protein